MSFPLWGALYQRRRNLHPAVGNPRPRPRPRRRRRLHDKRTRLHGKRTSLRPQRPLHPKMLHRKTGRLHARASAVGPWTPATLPSLASVLGPSPRHQRRRPSSVTTARASATPPVPVRTCQSAHSAVGHTGATSALRNALRASRPSTTATCVKRTATDEGHVSAETSPSPRSPSAALPLHRKTPWTPRHPRPPPASSPPRHQRQPPAASGHSATSHRLTK